MKRLADFITTFLMSIVLIAVFVLLAAAFVWLGYIALFSATASIIARLVCGSILVIIACLILVYALEPDQLIEESHREE